MIDSVKQYLKAPEWRKQHRWRRAIWHMMSSIGLTGVHALPLNRRWVEIESLGHPPFQLFTARHLSLVHRRHDRGGLTQRQVAR